MEDSKASLTIEELDERIVQLETRLADSKDINEEVSSIREDVDLLFESDTMISSRIDDNTERIDNTRVEKEFKTINERLDRLEDSTTIVMELEKMREARKDGNNRLKTMNATYITRMVLEGIAIIALSILIVGCTFEFPSHEIVPEKLDNSTWTCVPTVMDGMEVIKLIFDENGVDGNIFFMTRGEVKTRSFTTNDNEILFKAPPAKWLFYTDYEEHLTVECGDIEVEFTRARENI